jgi:hypothetical protein
MRYIRQYNQAPRTVKWKYSDLSRRITPHQPLPSTSGRMEYRKSERVHAVSVRRAHRMDALRQFR